MRSWPWLIFCLRDFPCRSLNITAKALQTLRTQLSCIPSNLIQPLHWHGLIDVPNYKFAEWGIRTQYCLKLPNISPVLGKQNGS